MQHTTTRFKIFTVCSLTVLLTACAPTLTKEQCQGYDMYQLGQTDGASGTDANKFVDYQTACNQYNLSLDQRQYQKGWSEGNKSYCQDDTAYQLGRRGKSYPVMCTGSNSKSMRKAYNKGFQIHQRIVMIENHIKAIDNDLHRTQEIESELTTITNKIIAKKQEIDNAVVDLAREQAKRDLDALNDKKDLLTTKLAVATAVSITRDSKLRAERDELIAELDRLKSTY